MVGPSFHWGQLTHLGPVDSTYSWGETFCPLRGSQVTTLEMDPVLVGISRCNLVQGRASSCRNLRNLEQIMDYLSIFEQIDLLLRCDHHISSRRNEVSTCTDYWINKHPNEFQMR